MDPNSPRQVHMDMSLEEFLFSDAALAMSFEGIDDILPQSRSPSSELGATNVVHAPETRAAQDLPLEAIAIDWQASFEQATEAAAGAVPNKPLHEDIDFSFLDQPGGDLEIDAAAQPQTSTEIPTVTAIDEFFIKRGAFRPPFPCNHCRRRRLQCLILQTSPANPNPTKSRSSCVALFRECSLSGSAKRVPSHFETSMPVIGHLHGVNEQGDSPEFPEERESSQAQPKSSSVSALSTKRANTRSVRKTRALRNWFSNHMDHPYPSEEEKVALAKESGLSKNQVVNWFANTRRRHRVSAQTQSNQANRVFLQGSPMPSQLGMSPMERWRNSPPDEEPASASAIENALSVHSSSQGSMEFAWMEAPDSATSGDSISYPHPNFNDASSNSASSYRSHRSALETSALSRSANSSAGEGLGSSRPTSRGGRSKLQAFQCTFCRQTYKKRYDWVRHERSIHLPGLDSWVCSIPVKDEQSRLVWRMNETNPQCVFCGHESPNEEHMQSHEFDTCAERPVAERKFTRKDHLWQHLQKFHRCRKWDGWKPDLSLLQHRQDTVRSRCGFCQLAMNSWEERMNHLASHFRSGLTMDSWTGGCGINDVESQAS